MRSYLISYGFLSDGLVAELEVLKINYHDGGILADGGKCIHLTRTLSRWILDLDMTLQNEILRD